MKGGGGRGALVALLLACLCGESRSWTRGAPSELRLLARGTGGSLGRSLGGNLGGRRLQTGRPVRSLVVATEGDGKDDLRQYTPKQLMREEIEAPFRKPRQVLAGFSAFSASTALFVSGSRAISCSLGYACIQPLDELLPNIAINLGVIGFAAGLLWSDQKKQASQLRRIARGGELATLQLSGLPPSYRNIAMRDLRGERRVVIVAGGPEVYLRTIATASAHAAELAAGDCVVVPVLLRVQSPGSPAARMVDPSGCTGGIAAAEAPWGDIPGIFLAPRGAENWGRWLEGEVETARKQGFDVVTSGVTLSIKKSGKIGKRSTSVPSWPELVESLAMIDRNFGMPTF
ncbi:hypothetical protein T492DRAFT_1104544 [Pavlovales sp. CCMP2436]|nr:hypothetical protein T492DRAFT_1104544 [Pavlovales sp. CCMP2436]